MLEATKVLESVEFYVRAYISDGASPNRKFYKIILTDEEGNINSTDNLFSELARLIFLFSDYVHLLKIHMGITIPETFM